MAQNITSGSFSVPRILLVADANAVFRAACRRYLGGFFRHVVMCRSIGEIELELEHSPVTDLLFGLTIGQACDITQAVRSWRDRQPRLKRVVLLTGGLAMPTFEGVDLVLTKPLEPRVLVDFLFPERRSSRVRMDAPAPLQVNQCIGD